MSIGTATGVLGRVRRATRSDEQLLSRARLGDDLCFEEIHRRYRPSLFGYCLMRLMDRQAAEDATQEVFIKAAAATGSPVENVKAWLFTIARNVVIDATRRRGSAPALLDLETIVDSANHSMEETAFSALDVTTNVFIALRRLAARERKALVLREFHDKSSQEIADELDTRPSNVDVLLCRARAAFGRAYAEVSELPLGCRQATETIYRQSGSGASEHKVRLMEAHLAICPRCRAEHQRSYAPRFLGGFIPLLWPGIRTGLGPIVSRLRSTAESTAAFLDRFILPGWSAPAKATVAVVIAATALTPSVVGHIAAGSAPVSENASASLAASSRRATTAAISGVGYFERTVSWPDADWSTSRTADRLCAWTHAEVMMPAHHSGQTDMNATTSHSEPAEATHDAGGATAEAAHHTAATHSEPAAATHQTGSTTAEPVHVTAPAVSGTGDASHEPATTADPGHDASVTNTESPHAQ